jgi:oligosaccharide repeat unit polymerase
VKKSAFRSGVPGGIWFLFVLLASLYYAVFYSGAPQLWLFAILYWCLATAFLYRYTRLQPFDILSPAIGLIVLLFLYAFASGVFVEEFGAMYYGEFATASVRRIYYVTCLVGLAGFCAGTLLGTPLRSSGRGVLSPRASTREVPADERFRGRLIFWSIALGLALAGFVLPQFNFLHVASYSETALNLRLERSAVANAGLKEVFLSQVPATLILCAATLLMFTAKETLLRLLGLSVFLAYVVANTLSGWRGAVVAALLFPMVYYHYRVRALTVRFALIGGLSIYLFVNALAVVRASSNPLEMISVLRENVGTNGLAFARLSSSGELAVGDNLMRLISGIQSGETTFTYGRSVIDELLVFVPRSLYADRPLPLSERFVEVFYPGVLESGGGYGFFILQDGYWAFGIAGVFVFMLAYGLAVQKIYWVFMAHASSDLWVLCYSAVYGALVLAAVRTGTMGSFKGAMINALPFLILWGLVKVGLPGLGRNPLAIPSLFDARHQ